MDLGEAHRGRLVFWRIFRRGRTVVELRRCSSRFCSTAMLGRGAGGHGESACKVGVEDGFQREAMKAAGGALGIGHGRWQWGIRFPCDFEQTNRFRWCARTRGVNGTRERGQNTGGSSESMKYCGGCCNLRRAIPAAWGHDLEREEGGRGEEREAFLYPRGCVNCGRE
jgi:hypothetical protein